MSISKDLPMKSGGQKQIFIFQSEQHSPKALPVGSVVKLPSSNSPAWTVQWRVQGSAKMPYIVSRKGTVDGSTSPDGFGCSCPAFTKQKSGREDCKHILKVKLKENFTTVKKAEVSPEHAAAFARFLKQEAAKKRAETVDNPGDVKMVGDSTGRKFR